MVNECGREVLSNSNRLFQKLCPSSTLTLLYRQTDQRQMRRTLDTRGKVGKGGCGCRRGRECQPFMKRYILTKKWADVPLAFLAYFCDLFFCLACDDELRISSPCSHISLLCIIGCGKAGAE
ncbi:unnamed protein product [Brugia pahangi]|uniref:Uncharacterized protein n=1 Tax=Brugia pahangi TaxID=6280 RepID=A0A0N4TY77_BRUPA|nr:unnamed protein product [Brugia pahangi]